MLGSLEPGATEVQRGVLRSGRWPWIGFGHWNWSCASMKDLIGARKLFNRICSLGIWFSSNCLCKPCHELCHLTFLDADLLIPGCKCSACRLCGSRAYDMHGRYAIEGAALRPEIAATVWLGCLLASSHPWHVLFFTKSSVSPFLLWCWLVLIFEALWRFMLPHFGFRHSSLLWTAPCRLNLRRKG